MEIIKPSSTGIFVLCTHIFVNYSPCLWEAEICLSRWVTNYRVVEYAKPITMQTFLQDFLVIFEGMFLR